MDNKSTTKRMIGAVVLVLIAALLLAWLLKGKSRGIEEKNIIADQTQEASPILGFPGVNKDGQTVDDHGQVVAADGTTSATQDGSTATQEAAVNPDGSANQNVVIGNPEDAAQQQAQSALSGQAQEGAGVGATVTSAVTEAVTAGKGVVQELAINVQPDTTGFQVRDPNGEVRQVVEAGKPVDGVGSMGTDVKTADANGKTAAETKTAAKATEQAVPEQQAATATETGNGKTSGKKATTASAASSAPTVASSGSSKAANDKAGSQMSVSSGDLKPAKMTNPKLVNERPVPAPVVAQAHTTSGTASSNRTASASTASSSNRATVSASASSGNAPAAAAPTVTATASAAVGKDGYVIQVLATSDKGKADGVKQSIAVDGYPAFVAQTKVDGKMVYRVRVGSYPGKSDAAAVQTRMKVRYGENQYVQNSFVTQN